MNTYGLIGFPLSHSFSKKYFTEKFQKEGLVHSSYNLYPLEKIEDLPGLLISTPSLLGLNVTIPYKESVLPYLDELDATAQAVGAVNTLKIKRTAGSVFIKGYNTDVFGFRQSIKPFLAAHHERALILGTGGASKAVAFVLKEIGVDCYFVTRNRNKFLEVRTGTGKNKVFDYAEITGQVLKHFPLIINASPVGMYPKAEDAPEIPYDFLNESHFLYDLIYNPEETRFLAEGKKRGALTLNGGSMLQQQAEKAWEIWNTPEA
jgi:shikimate dehydrogenase